MQVSILWLRRKKKKKKENGVSHFLPRLTNFNPPKFKDKSIIKMCTKNAFTILPFENHLTIFFNVLWTIVNPNKLSFPLFHFFSSTKKRKNRRIFHYLY